jgi:hypothetical protein
MAKTKTALLAVLAVAGLALAGCAQNEGPPATTGSGSSAPLAPVAGTGIQLPANAAPQTAPGSMGGVVPGTGTGIQVPATAAQPTFAPGSMGAIQSQGVGKKIQTQ